VQVLTASVVAAKGYRGQGMGMRLGGMLGILLSHAFWIFLGDPSKPQFVSAATILGQGIHRGNFSTSVRLSARMETPVCRARNRMNFNEFQCFKLKMALTNG